MLAPNAKKRRLANNSSYSCSLCKRTFPFQSKLKRHLDSQAHIHRAELHEAFANSAAGESTSTILIDSITVSPALESVTLEGMSNCCSSTHHCAACGCMYMYAHWCVHGVRVYSNFNSVRTPNKILLAVLYTFINILF